MIAVPPTSLPVADVYIDESSTQLRYLILGGIILPTDEVDRFVDVIWQARGQLLPAPGEMKWVKVSTAKLAAYRNVVDTFFLPKYRGGPHFHSLIVDTSQQRHAVFNGGSRDIGFNKELYQLAMKFGRAYSMLYHVYPDERVTNQLPSELRLMLNRGIKKAGDKRDWPFRRLQFRDSKKTPLLQLADIFSGAIAYQLNGHHLQPGASAAKTWLSAYVLKKAGISDVRRDTSRRGKFTLWHRQLKRVP